MVLATARRFVGNTHDAEDVFLSLARLAKRIRGGRALPAWLHQATCRIAAKVRKGRGCGSQEPSPEPCENIDPSAHLVCPEVRQALDEELQRLPQRLRSPLVLCYLSGLTRDEAARQLGWSLGTLKRRLEEGRKALRMRLARRGIASVGLALAVLTPEAPDATASTLLLDPTLRLIFSTRAAVPATIAALVLSSATTTKGLVMKSILALVAAIALGVGIYAGTGQADAPRQAEEAKEEVKPAQEEPVVQQDDPLPAGSTLRFGTSRFRHGFSIGVMAVSADGKMAVVGNGTSVSRWGVPTRAFDLVSGRVLFTLGNGEAHVIDISPDGQSIVTKASMATPHMYVCDSATGKVLRSIDLDQAQRIQGRPPRFTGHADLRAGRAAPFGSQDTTVLAWDMRPPRVADSVPLESAWNALAARDAGESFRSEGRFLSAPADTAKYFAERLRPVQALDPKRVQRLLVDLDSDQFAVRQAASNALGEMDQEAIPYFESTLKSTESAKVRDRLNRALERQWGAAIPLEQLRQIRAVVVLERIGDGESKTLLKEWADGPAGARLTREAAAAWKRLEAASGSKQ
jgi:RNA polymerase sigma factor (sigma-70 family)